MKLTFSVPMDQTSLQKASYTLVANVKHGKKKTTTSVSIASLMFPSSTSAILFFNPNQKFALGGTLTITSASAAGILSSAGAALTRATPS